MRRGLVGRDDDVTPWFKHAALRPWLFGLGIASAYVALQSPIDRGGDAYLLCIHMVQHLILMMIAPPLVLLGIAGAAPPPASVLPRARAVWSFITRPWQATLIFNAVLLVWHIPALYDATLTTEWIHVVEHLTFIAVGLVFWWPVVDPMRVRTGRPVSPFVKMAMLVLAGIPPTVLGFLFALVGTPVYDFYARAPRLWGMSAVLDQQVAGVIMFGLGNIVYFVAISVIFLRVLGNPADDEAEDDAAPSGKQMQRTRSQPPDPA